MERKGCGEMKDKKSKACVEGAQFLHFSIMFV
jgi:hypothetical protein